MAKTDAERALELIDQVALRQERMKVALEAILAEIGLKRTAANG